MFAGEYPEKLLENIINKQSELKQREIEITGLLPELNAIFNFSAHKPRVKFFEGREGIKQIYQDTLYNNKEILAFLSIKEFDKQLLRQLYKEYVPLRIKKGIPAYVIAPGEPLSAEYKKRDKDELRETRLVDPKKYPFSIEIDIYNNKVSLMSYTANELFGVIIESEQVHKTMKFIFKLIWENIKDS